MPVDDYKKFGFPGCEDLGNQFLWGYLNKDIFCGNRDPAVAKGLVPGTLDLDGWLAEFKGSIPLE